MPNFRVLASIFKHIFNFLLEKKGGRKKEREKTKNYSYHRLKAAGPQTIMMATEALIGL